MEFKNVIVKLHNKDKDKWLCVFWSEEREREKEGRKANN